MPADLFMPICPEFPTSSRVVYEAPVWSLMSDDCGLILAELVLRQQARRVCFEDDLCTTLVLYCAAADAAEEGDAVAAPAVNDGDDEEDDAAEAVSTAMTRRWGALR